MIKVVIVVCLDWYSMIFGEYRRFARDQGKLKHIITRMTRGVTFGEIHMVDGSFA